MQYAILCYNDEAVVGSWTREEDEACMARLGVVQEDLIRRGKLGPHGRLLPTTTATTLRKDRDPPLVIDGPFAETKEHLLGFYVLDVESLDEALDLIAPLETALAGYFHFHGLRGNLLMQLGRNREARRAFDQAIGLANTAAEAAHIRVHLDRLSHA